MCVFKIFKDCVWQMSLILISSLLDHLRTSKMQTLGYSSVNVRFYSWLDYRLSSHMSEEEKKSEYLIRPL